MITKIQFTYGPRTSTLDVPWVRQLHNSNLPLAILSDDLGDRFPAGLYLRTLDTGAWRLLLTLPQLSQLEPTYTFRVFQSLGTAFVGVDGTQAYVNQALQATTTVPINDARPWVLAIPKVAPGRLAGTYTGWQLTSTDDGATLICATPQTAVVNTGLPRGFGVAFKGTISFSGTATVNDVRSSGSANPWCALMQTAANTYDVVGSKT